MLHRRNNGCLVGDGNPDVEPRRRQTDHTQRREGLDKNGTSVRVGRGCLLQELIRIGPQLDDDSLQDVADPAGPYRLSATNPADGRGVTGDGGETEIRAKRLRDRSQHGPMSHVRSDDRMVIGTGNRAGVVVLDQEQLGEPNDGGTVSRNERNGTIVLRLSLDQASAKVRTGGPVDEPEDYELPIWAGVVPMAMTYGEPITDDASLRDVAVPDHALAFSRAPA